MPRVAATFYFRPEQHFAILLDGLKIDEDAHVIDNLENSTMSDIIGDRVSQALQKTKPKAKRSRSKQKPASQVTPAIWKQGSLLETQFVPSQNTDASGQGKLLEMQFVPSSENAKAEAPTPEPPTTPVEPEPPKSSVLTVATDSEIRAKLEQAILNDLLGPAGGAEEELTKCE